MHWRDFHLSENCVDPETGRYRERTTPSRINRNHPAYLERSIGRLVLFADEGIPKTKEQECRQMQLYGHLLQTEQREALIEWCRQ
jgi:hypothetical protein